MVGNTAMHHLFAGLPTRQLGEAPYVPAVSAALIIPAGRTWAESGTGVQVYLPPNIAGFVGADHVSADLACGLTGSGENTLLVDIGTNTEITLRTPEGISCCSCASGPAFEGAHIHAGMRAAPGAIERVTYHEGIWNYQTIDGKPPIGICGSGILDAVAEMRRAGVIDDRGTLQAGASGVERLGQELVFRLVSADPVNKLDGIHITRRDVNEIQLAKAAIRAGIEILLKGARYTSTATDEIHCGRCFWKLYKPGKRTGDRDVSRPAGGTIFPGRECRRCRRQDDADFEESPPGSHGTAGTDALCRVNHP